MKWTAFLSLFIHGGVLLFLCLYQNSTPMIPPQRISPLIVDVVSVSDKATSPKISENLQPKKSTTPQPEKKRQGEETRRFEEKQVSSPPLPSPPLKKELKPLPLLPKVIEPPMEDMGLLKKKVKQEEKKVEEPQKTPVKVQEKVIPPKPPLPIKAPIKDQKPQEEPKLVNLRQNKNTQSHTRDVKKEKKKLDDLIGDIPSDIKDEGDSSFKAETVGALSASEMSLLKAHIQKHWNIPSGVASRDVSVIVLVVLDTQGQVVSMKVMNKQQSSAFLTMEESVKRAIHAAQPLPISKAHLFKEGFELVFDPKESS